MNTPLSLLKQSLVALVAFTTLSSLAQNFAGDMALSKVLIDGEDWELVAEGYQFTDATCSDADGNFYFTDVAGGSTINRIGPDGNASEFLTGMPRISGLKWGPDGRFYACVQAPAKQVVAIEVPSGKITVLAEDVQPNDLIVSHRGDVYFTETGPGQVTLIDAQGKKRVAASGINKPNGISLSPDQGTLVVSEYGGTNAWAYRIEKDGTLSAGERYMTLRAPHGKSATQGDGMTTDTEGRYYITSALGIQMFDATGRISGIIAKPQADQPCVSVAFAGPKLQYLYAASKSHIYRRKTQAKGVVFQAAPTQD